MRPEDKSADDNQMGPRQIKSSSGTSGRTAGVSLDAEDKSGLPQGTGPAATPDTKAYTNAPNVAAVPVNKSRGTGVQINNGALTGGQSNPAGTGPMPDDDGSGYGGSGQGTMGGGSTASQMAKVTKVSGETVPGMNYGPSIGRYDSPPAVIKRTGTDDSVEDAASAVRDRWPGTDTEHVWPEARNGNDTGVDRLWR